MTGLIGVAAQEEARFTAFHMALDALQRPDGSMLTYGIGNNIAHNYNQMIRNVIENKLDWLWLIDNDHVFDPDILMKLLAHDKPIVCPVNVRRSHPYGTTLHDSVDDGLKQIQWTDMAGWTGLVDIGGLNIGSSGMLIQREALEDIDSPWYTNSHAMGENLSFDLEFCEKIRKAGHKIYLDTETTCGHIGIIAAWPARDDEGNWDFSLRLP